MPVTYDSRFFSNQSGALKSARRILPLVLETTRARSVIDVGSGIGAWAKVAKELGCTIAALDGDWVPQEQLLIDPTEFVRVDLANPPQDFGRRFDLALSLEVAEHLPPASAEPFVRFLASLAPVVVFSAAVPWQLGTHHVNEQYPGYWARRFEACGFVAFDAIRPRIWYDEEVEFYYRQNAILYVSRDGATEFERTAGLATLVHPLDVIHPDALPILAQGWVEAGGTMRCLELLRRTAVHSLKKRFGRT
jgi:SAM-dependent methyltransferase